ncbi:twin-arginine translocation signal domain-containing protein [Bradyrhizobium sp. CCGUVB23]|uniref:twin-arginine translocation signal domain-containing protein n=1 Tax=Bradyrhizobium sp. CCGUVB23 TaxID=2949630 RepID=UPI003531CC19
MAGNTSRRNFLAVSALAAAAATIPVIPAARAASPDQELMNLGATFFCDQRALRGCRRGLRRAD